MNLSSLKSKIIIMAMAIIAISLVITTAIQAYLHVQSSKELFVTSITASVDVIAYNLEPALVFDDKVGARDIVSALEAQVGILNVALYKSAVQNKNSNLLLFISSSNAKAKPNLVDPKQALSLSLDKNRIYYQKPIYSDKELIGVILIEAEMSVFKNIISDTLLSAFFTLLPTGIVALSLALIVSNKITQPIQALVKIADEIGHAKTFSIRAPKLKSKEMLRLGNAINHMLDIIEQEITQRKQSEVHIQELNASLETKVEKRTAQLETKNTELAATLKTLNESRYRLVEQEKMASLGGLVAGVAHEINTPVGIGITATSHMLDLIKGLEQALSTNRISKSKFEHDISILNESARITLHNLERAANLVHSFKLVAVDQSSLDSRIFNLYEYLEEVILSLKPKLSKNKHKITLQGKRDVFVHIKPGSIAQLISNMVLNSLNHAFDGIEQGEMLIKVDADDEMVFLDYQDFGIGVNEEDLERLFLPFFTTKRGEGGSGLGTHIMYNIVNHGLGGQITASSAEGEGLHYKINFPKNMTESTMAGS